jgi:Fibronectin type III-like domain
VAAEAGVSRATVSYVLNGADAKHRITPATRDRVLEVPGQSRFVLFHLTPSDLAYYSTAASRWTVAPGRYTVLLWRRIGNRL